MIRTSLCGELNLKSIDREVTLAGWVNTRRDHGNLIFIDLRDRWGVTQVVFNPDHVKEVHKLAEGLRTEFVIRVKGKVQKRPDGTTNNKIATGEIEVLADYLEVLNPSPTPPFELGETSVNEELRLKYRFLDLRRKEMVESLTFRHQLVQAVREHLDKQNFLEIETPYLTKSTPEGARDFLVPARLTPETFYALPQSPQLFKQLLMVAGYDRYYQLARCFRDEDLRSDRQPEHTQIDMEMSFVEEDDVMMTVEGLVREVFQKTLGVKLPNPFPRFSYQEVMSRFGTDKPDLRYGMQLRDLSEIFQNSGFKIFDSCLASEGKIKGIRFHAPKELDLSRKFFDNLTRWISAFGAKGLAWFKVTGEKTVESPIQKFFDPKLITKLIQKFHAHKGDVILIVASDPEISTKALGALRVHLAEKYLNISDKAFEVLWVNEFPMFEWNPDEKRYQALHHPFTSPRPEDLALLEKDPSKVRARAYDLVLNGTELGGGSIRIHQQDVQRQVFRALGINEKEAESRFGFLLKALNFGAPPHGGLAIGLDRFVALLLGRESIREVIAFPKTQKGTCLMTEAPSDVNPAQLKELHLNIRKT